MKKRVMTPQRRERHKRKNSAPHKGGICSRIGDHRDKIAPIRLAGA